MACTLISFYFYENGMLIACVASAFASRGGSLMEPITFPGNLRSPLFMCVLICRYASPVSCSFENYEGKVGQYLSLFALQLKSVTAWVSIIYTGRIISAFGTQIFGTHDFIGITSCFYLCQAGCTNEKAKYASK